MARKLTKQKALREARPSYGAVLTGEELWRAFNELSEDERDAFLRKFLEDEGLREDLMDSITMIERRNEPTRRYRDVREDFRREGLL